MHQPTTASERYFLLDLLRGFALLGVLIANMSTHSGYFFLSEQQQDAMPTAYADHPIMFTLHFLVEGKFYSLFSLLFGIGFALQLKRSGEHGTRFGARFARRIGVLFLIGLLHALLFYVGDILTVYAITGIFLLLFRNASNKMILRWALLFMLLPIIQYLFFWIPALLDPAAPAPAPDPNAPRFFDQLIVQYQTDGLLENIRTNIGGLLFGRWPDLIFTGRLFRIMAMFLLGYYAARKMLFADLTTHKPLLKKIMTWGAIIGFPCNLVLAFMMENQAYESLALSGIILPIVYGAGVPALALFYAAAVALIYEKNKDTLLRIFAPVGQMALTNYLLQSIIASFIFKGFGLGYFGKMPPLYLMAIAIIIFVFQLLMSHWWLKRFRFGPMEWLWRSATYGKWQQFAREKTPVAA